MHGQVYPSWCHTNDLFVYDPLSSSGYPMVIYMHTHPVAGSQFTHKKLWLLGDCKQIQKSTTHIHAHSHVCMYTKIGTLNINEPHTCTQHEYRPCYNKKEQSQKKKEDIWCVSSGVWKQDPSHPTTRYRSDTHTHILYTIPMQPIRYTTDVDLILKSEPLRVQVGNAKVIWLVCNFSH